MGTAIITQQLLVRQVPDEFHIAQAMLAGTTSDQQPIEIVQDIYDPFYGGREFCVRDLNGYELYFRQG